MYPLYAYSMHSRQSHYYFFDCVIYKPSKYETFIICQSTVFLDLFGDIIIKQVRVDLNGGFPLSLWERDLDIGKENNVLVYKI